MASSRSKRHTATAGVGLPMAWIVKAHVFQAIRGTFGHSSLGAVCSPTRWTVVAHTTNISTMLSENFLLQTEFRRVTRRKEQRLLSDANTWDHCLTHGSCTP